MNKKFSSMIVSESKSKDCKINGTLEKKKSNKQLDLIQDPLIESLRLLNKTAYSSRINREKSPMIKIENLNTNPSSVRQLEQRKNFKTIITDKNDKKNFKIDPLPKH